MVRHRRTSALKSWKCRFQESFFYFTFHFLNCILVNNILMHLHVRKHLHPDAAKQEAQERCRFSNTRNFIWKSEVKSKMHKFNSMNARISGSPWQTPKHKTCKFHYKLTIYESIDFFKCSTLIFSVSSSLFNMLILSVWEFLAAFHWTFTPASSFSSITCSLYNYSYCSIRLSNSAWTLEDISVLP